MEVIQSVRFRYEKTPEIQSLLETFRDMINFCIERALQHKVTSFMRLRALIYDEFKRRFEGYNTQYCYSAVRIACNILKSCRKRGREPRAKRLFIQFSPQLTKFYGDRVRISVKPNQFVTIPLEVKEYHRRFIELWERGEAKIGEIILNSDYVIIPFKREIDLTESSNKVAFDLNEQSLVGLTNDGILINIDLSEAKRIHDTYFEKRRSIQSKLSNKPSLMKKILAKYRGREKNRVKDLLHKVSKIIAALVKGYTIIMEDLTNIRRGIYFSKKMNRRLHSWNFRLLQSLIEYKANLSGSKVIYIDPKNTSRVCSGCGGVIESTERACPNCGLDRHVNACINILRKQDVASQGSAESPLMNLLKRGTGEVAKIGRAITLTYFPTAYLLSV